MTVIATPSPVELLILGAGWTSTFLIPLLERESVLFAATTTTGRDGTIPFKYDPDSDDEAPFLRLPAATTVLITFPLKGKGPSKRLADLYNSTHPPPDPGLSGGAHFIQLGATSIWTAPTWSDHTSPYDRDNARAVAEDELIDVAQGCALNLAGLYGGSRQPRNWVDRVVRTKSDLRAKGALHLIHGDDVARAVLALHRRWTPQTRWLLTDLHVYDWWDLAQDWAVATLAAAEAGQPVDAPTLARQQELQAWVGELMWEEDVKALPREPARLGRVLDSRQFWKAVGVWPSHGRVR